MHPGSQTIAIGGGAGEIFLHALDSSDPESGPISLGKVARDPRFTFRSSGAYLAAAGGDHQIRIIEIKPRRIIKTIGRPHQSDQSSGHRHNGRMM
jgi:hypothetical protein